MRHVYVVTLVCLLISLVLAGSFVLTYKPGTLDDGTSTTGLTASSSAPLVEKPAMSLEATEQANLIGMGVILAAVVVVTVAAFYRKPGASDDEV